jgi:hypothetical protein
MDWDTVEARLDAHAQRGKLRGALSVLSPARPPTCPAGPAPAWNATEKPWRSTQGTGPLLADTEDGFSATYVSQGPAASAPAAS